MLKNLKKMIFAIAFIYLILVITLFSFQRKLQYHPQGDATKIAYCSPPGFEKKYLTTTDGVKILAWYQKPKTPHNKIILYFHGNAGNFSEREHKFQSFVKNKLGVLAISYRGYPGSEGSPSELGLIKDADAALVFLLDQGYKPKDIIFYGESLGSGVAIQLAARINPAAVILESPFSSIANVAKKTYWFVPVNLILKDKFESIKYVSNITAPVLIIHGTADQVVPYSEGKKLFDAIISPKRFIAVEGAGHLKFEDKFLMEEMQKFFTEMRLNKPQRKNKNTVK